MTDGFYDIHCHILPGVDDGAKTFDEAMKMLRIGRGEGIRHVVLTPHYHVGHYELPAENLRQRFRILQREAARVYPDMKLYLGCEICYHLEAARRLEHGELLKMAGTSCALIEFFPHSELRTIIEGLQEIQMAGIQPIVAHVERYQKVTESVDNVERMIQMGFYIQVNASSILGKNGKRAKQFVKRLLDDGLVHFVATDAHGTEHRRPEMLECADYLCKKWSRTYAEELLIRNPQCILQGGYL